jgi:hypothetical protein
MRWIPDGVECGHPGCSRHISHPCEGCGRIGAVNADKIPESGIMNAVPNGSGWNSEAPITLESVAAAAAKFPPAEDPNVAIWRDRILAGWVKYGTGEPLDPRTVEHLAREFARPLALPEVKMPWNSGKANQNG